MTEKDEGVPYVDTSREDLLKHRDTVKAVLQDFEDKDKGARAPRSAEGTRIARERQATRKHFKKEKKNEDRSNNSSTGRELDS